MARTNIHLLLMMTVGLNVASARSLDARQLIVSQQAAASDTNPGTQEQPLRTINAAAAKVGPGDEVIIHGGDYRETVVITASGTPNAPIVFEAAKGETVVIKGSDVMTGWVQHADNVWSASVAPPPPKAEKPEDPGFWTSNDVGQVFARDGILLDAVHLRPAASQELKEGQFFFDQPSRALAIRLPGDQNPNELTIEASVRSMWLYVKGRNVVVRGLQMRHANAVAPMTGVACNVLGENDLLENCALSWANFVGLGIGGKNNRVRWCTIACNGNSGINANGEEHLIERCRVIYNNIDRYYFDWHAGGAKLIPNFSRGRVANNEFAYNIGDGLWLDGLSNDNLVEANLCHDNEGPGIQVEISTGNRVYNNICFGNRNPTMADYLTPDDPATGKPTNQLHQIRKGGEPSANPVYHSGEARGIYISSAPNTKVYHNTCYLNEGEGICVEGPARQTSAGPMSAHDCEVFNNITAYNKGTQLVVRRNQSDEVTYGNKSDYNLIVARGAVLAEAGWGARFMQLKDWQQKTGNDQHSIQADPAFAMAAMGDFRLLPISPAAVGARKLDAVVADFGGRVRPNERVTMGACEVTTYDYPRNDQISAYGWNTDGPPQK